MQLRFLVLVLVASCSEPVAENTTPDANIQMSVGCPNGQASKIKFTEAQSCVNDGSVEFCAAEADASLRAQLASISPTISCAPGGGRARCSQQGLLLCFYPTAFPNECSSVHGAMTSDVWIDMCAIAGLPEIVEIVPTIAE